MLKTGDDDGDFIIYQPYQADKPLGICPKLCYGIMYLNSH
ncbi:hypothetical protein AO372_0638 [Moraxella catarrhalis]|nr:hypothetical protein AO381_1287 [Moraxella catarrhalis]OAV05656.1 hypothetical protein AO379_1386 [Moraxella catarrhalis]OAV17525.1 hypothetical protein AO373_1767 [Moraxella catarrhalis]OAV21890.1 hypothetical protein AO372_0638 [Moraxella catarrhalis]OAV24857.1 hypothetical protein AO369_1574 [Moraxella catarrhalis]